MCSNNKGNIIVLNITIPPSGAIGYYETSALTGVGVGDAMMATIRAGLSGSNSGATSRRRRFVWPWKRCVCMCVCVCVCACVSPYTQ